MVIRKPTKKKFRFIVTTRTKKGKHIQELLKNKTQVEAFVKTAKAFGDKKIKIKKL
jgi:hypothetical protein